MIGSPEIKVSESLESESSVDRHTTLTERARRGDFTQRAKLEAEAGIEPANDGFANHCLTTWLLRLLPFAWGLGCYALCGVVSMPGLSVPPNKSDRELTGIP